MDEFEITCIIKDSSGTISHYGVKGYGVQSVAIIDKLIREEACSFFTFDRDNKLNVYTTTYPDGRILLTTDPKGLGTKGLDFLPLYDRPLLRQLIESVR